ncbi:MAG: glucose-6-phosphate isomerase [Clostridiales bacterium]|nr:glucose-6-phosphate isomerase [Clostridiales bacterium]
MAAWTITKTGKSVRYTHERGVFSLDFNHSLNFDLTTLIDPGFHQKANKVMADTEKGVHVNESEDRMVGHYWLRNPGLAPDKGIGDEITRAVDRIEEFAGNVHEGRVANEAGEAFKYLAVIGIGGSQLGFQCVSKALSDYRFKLGLFTLDNTDPDSVDAMIRSVGEGNLDKVLFVVASKSGGTTEIRNLYTVLERVYREKGLLFSKHAVAVTMDGSAMYEYAKGQQWLDIFPVWDWVGGRFSVLSPVGTLPLALLGLDADGLLAGAYAMDELTRSPAYPDNPAMLLAHYMILQSEGNGKHHLVVLPYKDKLDLWGKFLQQLFMESLGKTLETDNGPRHSGLSIFGNKGTTDQHSYVQQLLAGHNDFFAIFIKVLQEKGQAVDTEVEEGGVTMGDYLLAFCHGTMNAMKARGRESMAITMERLDPFSLGGLIALFERIVGYIAAYVGINPYDQPQVEEGKRSAKAIIEIQKKLNGLASAGGDLGVDALKKSFAPDEYHVIYYLLQHMREQGRVKGEWADYDGLLD